MRINIKEGVKFRVFNEFFTMFHMGLIRATHAFITFNHGTWLPTITSANDGVHGKNSLHFKDLAWDIRSNDLPKHLKGEFLRGLQIQLGKDFQCLYEEEETDATGAITKGEHFHVEYDPKR